MTDKDHGQDEAQKTVDKEEEQGFRGVKVDPTPDAHYSVSGVLAGKPTPETDDKAAAKADKASGS
ncbi:MAG TPA: hypothetical protein VIM25_06255 [Candidatus Limnocylindrales bacterium]